MALTTYKNEKFIFAAKNGEALVSVSRENGAPFFVAVTRDGFRTDYPMWDGVSMVRWDHPEWFTKAFRARVARYIFQSK